MRVLSPFLMLFRVAVGKQNIFFHQSICISIWAAIIHLDIDIRIKNVFFMPQRIWRGPVSIINKVFIDNEL